MNRFRIFLLNSFLRKNPKFRESFRLLETSIRNNQESQRNNHFSRLIFSWRVQWNYAYCPFYSDLILLTWTHSGNAWSMEWNENSSKQKIDQESKRKGFYKIFKKTLKYSFWMKKWSPMAKLFFNLFLKI